MNDDTPLQHVDSFIYQVKWNRLLQVFWNAISLSVFSYLNLHPFFTACLRVKWKQEESEGQAIHAFHAKERWADNFHLGILNGANLITLFDFSIFIWYLSFKLFEICHFQLKEWYTRTRLPCHCLAFRNGQSWIATGM